MQAEPTMAAERGALSRSVWPMLASLVLVGLADYLILTASPGLGWFVFAIALALALVGSALARHRSRTALFAGVMVIAAALPLLETPSLPGLFVVSLSLAIAALLAARLLPAALGRIPAVLVRYAILAPFRLISDAVSARLNTGGGGLGRVLARQLIGWMVPLVFLAIFLWLFLAANPVLDLAASQFSLGDVVFPEPIRLFAWAVLAAAIWALLRPRLLRRFKRTMVVTPVAKAESLLFGRAAILRSLIIFNAIFAVQTALDLTYLWGGVTLPAGMSHADYAHRGAFPLIVTALLAAVFVLAAMRPNGPGMHSRLIRGLVYAWIGQNVLLCISAILRLDLYVEAYSLTELRVAAGIWMGLVAAGLMLILLRIALRQTSGWLIATNLLSLTITLYACAWVDFSALIARFNVEHSQEVSGDGMRLDLDYLYVLGPTVIPALDDYTARIGRRSDVDAVREQLVRDARQQAPEDWRGWSWRQQRLTDYLDSGDGNDNNSSTPPD